jgi:hypothetical protein
MTQVFTRTHSGTSEYVDVEIAGDGSARIVRQILDSDGELEVTWGLTADQVRALCLALGPSVDDGLAPTSDDPGFGRALADAIDVLEPPASAHSWVSED